MCSVKLEFESFTTTGVEAGANSKAEAMGGECKMDKLSIDVRICYFGCKDTPFLGEQKILRENLNHKSSFTVKECVFCQF